MLDVRFSVWWAKSPAAMEIHKGGRSKELEAASGVSARRRLACDGRNLR